MATYRKQFGKTHAAQALANVALRDSPVWDRYFNADLGRFVSKTGTVTVGHRSVRAGDLYRSAYNSESLVPPRGFQFNNESGRLMKARAPRAGESKQNRIIYRGQPPVFQPHEFLVDNVVTEGEYSMTIEFYGAPDAVINDPKRRSGHHTGCGLRHQQLQIFGRPIVMNGFPVVVSCLAQRTFTVRGSQLDETHFTRRPQPERVYFTGSDDFIRLTSLIPENMRPLFLSRIDVAKVVSVTRNPGSSGRAEADVPRGDDATPQILSHPLTTTRLVERDGEPHFGTTAPICAEADCVLAVIVDWKAAAFKERLNITLTKAWLLNFLGIKGTTRVSYNQMKPFFRRFRLKFTALNIAGEIVDSYSPESDGMSRNKKMDNIHLIFVGHNEHIYVLDRDKTSTERLSHPKAGTPPLAPRLTFSTPPQTGYEGGTASDAASLLRLLLTRVSDDPGTHRIAYTGGMDALFCYLRQRHSLEPQVLVKQNHIAALTLHLNGHQFTVCDVPSANPAAYTLWMNRFKRGFFHDDRKSQYSDNLARVFTELRKAQLVCRFAASAPFSAVGVDVSRFYTRAALDIAKVPVFLATDDFVAYGGEAIADWSIYLVENYELSVERYLIADRTLSAVSGYVLKRCGLPFTIRYVIRPSHLATNPFPSLVNDLYTNTEDASIRKSVPLHLIGMAGKMIARNERGFFTTNADEAHSLGDIVAVPHLGGYFATRSSAEVTLTEGYYPFQFLVYDLARLQMLTLYRKLLAAGATVYGMLTDKFFVDELPPSLPTLVGTCGVADIGGYRVEHAKPVPQTLFALRDAIHIVPQQALTHVAVTVKDPERNTLILALHAGGGKTVASFAGLDPSTTLAVAPTNLQCESLSRRFGCDAMTVARFLGHRVVEDGVEQRLPPSLTGIRTIVLDELYQNSLTLIVRLLGRVAEHTDIVWVANGDTHQNTNHETVNNVNRTAYLSRILPRYFTDCVTLTTCHRFKSEADKAAVAGIREALASGAKARDIVANFGLKTIKNLDELRTLNIRKAVTLSNATAHVVNQAIQGDIPDAAGMTVISKEWHKDLTMNKSYVVERIQGKYYIIDGKAYRRSMFRLPFSLTCHCVQGETIAEPYAVFDALSTYADANWLYTALTRAETLDSVYVYVGEPVFQTFRLAEKLRSYKTQDEKAGRKFDLDYNGCLALMSEANYACAHCHERVELYYEADDPRQFSLDRLNNDWGHIRGNIRLTHFGCNRALGTVGKNLVPNNDD